MSDRVPSASLRVSSKILQRRHDSASTRYVSGASLNPSDVPISEHGLHNVTAEYWNLPHHVLVEHAIQNGEGHLGKGGALLVETGHHTGRAAKDKYFVMEPSSKDNIDWTNNASLTEEQFDRLHTKAVAYMQHRSVYVMDLVAGHDPDHKLPVRVVTENAWHAAFAGTMLVRPQADKLKAHKPEFTIIHVPGMNADPARDGTTSTTFIALHLGKNMAVIGGTHYAGEVKKCIFTVVNYYLPLKGYMTMHAAANCDEEGRSAIFFGLSGTGKTTLSADPHRRLIGDDEHIWTAERVSNVEGGCYAKIIRLDPEAEPEIYATTTMFGTIVENTVMDPVTRELDLDRADLTENTRCAYPLTSIPHRQESGYAGQPLNIVFLTCDAFGILPPISQLEPAQAEFWFLLGYTAKVAGTEHGVTEPQATFSACFGLPFMPLRPTEYAKLLSQKIKEQKVKVWLMNTGWSGGAYGTGKRFSIKHTRTLLNAALDGKLDLSTNFEMHELFKLKMPVACEGVPSQVLNPRNTWTDTAAYDSKAQYLVELCREEFAKYSDHVSAEVSKYIP
eukprot:m.354161 g.354161  ORF g.354161 m.354161 type:complete len:560 (-) comp16942_c0_seq1:303-1982(-)